MATVIVISLVVIGVLIQDIKSKSIQIQRKNHALETLIKSAHKNGDTESVLAAQRILYCLSDDEVKVLDLVNKAAK